MKKFLLTLGLVGIFWGLVMLASASGNSCRNVEFSNGIDACVDIDNAGRNDWELSTDLDGGNNSNLRCDLMTPDSILRSIPNCNGEFEYDGDEPGRIKLRIRYNNNAPEDRDGKPSSNSTRTYPQWVYDFDNEERIDDDLDDSNDNGDTSDYTVTASPSDPDKNEWIDVTVKAMDGSSTDTSYRGTVKFKVERKSGSSWTTASSSLYEISTTSYKFTSSNAGRKTFTDLIRFKDDSYDYRLTIYDYNDNSLKAYKIFSLDGNDNNGDIEELAITSVSPSDPDEDEWVDVTVEARDDNEDTVENYTSKIKFKVETRDDSNDERETASSSDYELDLTTYTFTTSDDGKHKFTDLVRFLDDTEDYRLVVYDYNDSSVDEGYKVFDFGNGYDEDDEETTGDTDGFYLTTYDSTPNANSRASLTVTARDGNTKDTSYRGTIMFDIYYKSSSSSTRTKTTSSTYYEMNTSKRYQDRGYTFKSTDNGVFEDTYFIKFKKNNYQYKIHVYDEDDDDIDGEKIFTVGTTSTTNDDTDNFYITTDDSTPTASQYVDLTIEARDGTTKDTSYRGTIQFEVYYKASGSYTRTKTTSSTYYTMAGNYEDDGYAFTSSNRGQKTFNNLIKFNKKNYSYKVIVYDENDEDIEGYKIFTVGTVNNDSNVDGFTDSELRTLWSIYEARPDAINRLEDRYSRLENSSRRQSMADDIYDEMEKVLEDDNDREYKDFMDFYNAFLDRYRYTTSIR